MEHAVDMAALGAHWDELPRRQQRILLLRFYGNMTQAEIGQQLGLSQMHVSRLISQSLAYLRERMLGPDQSGPGGRARSGRHEDRRLHRRHRRRGHPGPRGQRPGAGRQPPAGRRDHHRGRHRRAAGAAVARGRLAAPALGRPPGRAGSGAAGAWPTPTRSPTRPTCCRTRPCWPPRSSTGSGPTAGRSRPPPARPAPPAGTGPASTFPSPGRPPGGPAGRAAGPRPLRSVDLGRERGPGQHGDRGTRNEFG